jgi:U3 small nucleolar RNA-associated protein 10
MLDECSTTLFLALQHPDQQIRLLAVEKVVKQLTEGNFDDQQFEEFIKDALLERLMDDSPDIVSRVFQIADVLLDKVEPEALFKQLSSIITRSCFPFPLFPFAFPLWKGNSFSFGFLLRLL